MPNPHTTATRKKAGGKVGVKAAKIPKMPKPLRRRVEAEKPESVHVYEPANSQGGDPVVEITKDGRRKVVGAWIEA